MPRERASAQLSLQLSGVDAPQIVDTTFHERLKAFMRRSFVTNQRLAKTLGVATTTVDRWLSGETPPRACDIAPICQLLGVTPNELIGFGEESAPTRITRREALYLETITHGGQFDSSKLTAMAAIINRGANGITTLELILNSVAEVVERLERLKEEDDLL